MEWKEDDLSGHLFAHSDDQTGTYWIEELAWVYLSFSDQNGIKTLGTFNTVEDAKLEAETLEKQAA